jgi:hypothetical protein
VRKKKENEKKRKNISNERRTNEREKKKYKVCISTGPAAETLREVPSVITGRNEQQGKEKRQIYDISADFIFTGSR